MALNRDAKLLFITRSIRLFSYGMLAVVLLFYLTGLRLTESQTGLFLTLTLAGDTAVSLALTSQADRIGRRRTLVAGAVLMAAAGVAFALTRQFLLLVVAGTIGVISPSGNEVGPFLSVEQAALSEVIPSRDRTSVFAWYALAGSLATALGSLFGGVVSGFLQKSSGMTAIRSERMIVFMYAATFEVNLPIKSSANPHRPTLASLANNRAACLARIRPPPARRSAGETAQTPLPDGRGSTTCRTSAGTSPHSAGRSARSRASP